MAMPTLADADDFVRVLWWGLDKSGKTVDAASLAKRGKIVYVNMEGGVKKVAMDKHEIPATNILVPPISDYEDLERLYWKLKTTKKPPLGVVLDSDTELQSRILTELLTANGTKKGVDTFQANMDTRTRANEMFRRMVRYYRDLPCHLGMTALSRRDEDEDDGTVRYGPALTPGVQGDVAGYVDIVCYTRVVPVGDDHQYEGWFITPDGKHKAGDRFGVMPKMLVNPTFDRIIDYVQGTLTVATDDVMLAAREARKENPKQRKRRRSA